MSPAEHQGGESKPNGASASNSSQSRLKQLKPILIGIGGVVLIAAGFWGYREFQAYRYLQRLLEGRRVIENSIGMKLRLIVPGSFPMGTADPDSEDYEDEAPQHTVKLTKPFYLGVHEVTQEEFEQVIGRNPSYFSKRGNGKQTVSGVRTDQFPVESVTWDDAVEFCHRLSQNPAEVAAGRMYRLPTEAEWEYACRAESEDSVESKAGDELKQLRQRGWSLHTSGNRRPSSVGEKRANTWGLYDVHGNVSEWCSDSYAADYYSRSPWYNPTGPDTPDDDRVIRGGSWNHIPMNCRAASRDHASQFGRDKRIGFRVVCERSIR